MIKDLTYKRFGKLLVTSFSHLGLHSRAIWNCTCDCGKETKVKSASLINGNTKSCGCGRGGKNVLPDGESGLNELLYYYKKSANIRGCKFELSIGEFKEVTKKNCFYCGREPTQVIHKNRRKSSYIYNGIDRIDNSKGYNTNNIVPCCKICNRAKDIMTQEEFYEWVTKIYSNLELRK